MPIKVKVHPQRKACSIGFGGVGFSTSTIDKSGWKIGDKIAVGFIQETKCLLFSKPSNNGDTFGLAYSNGPKKTGGKIYCISFIKNYLQALVSIPKQNILPVFIDDGQWRVALVLDELVWRLADFSKNGCDNIPAGTMGVYQLLGKNDSILRIGEGSIKDRFKSYLNDPTRFLPVTKSFRYIPLEEKEDAQLMEKIFITQYEEETGVLPPLNYIRA